MDIPVELIKWIVVIGLIYYILDRTPIGIPLKQAMVRLMLWLWSHAKAGRGNPQLNKEMERLEEKYGVQQQKKRHRGRHS